MESDAFVIVVSGTSGAGKSSLVRQIAGLLGDATSLHFDDYRSVSQYPEDFSAWLANGADPNEWRTPRLAADLRLLRQGEPIRLPDSDARVKPAPYIVLEDPFSRARREIADSIDLVVYIDLPLDVAMMRKLRREVNGIACEHGPQAGLDRLNGFLGDFLDGPVRDVYIAANAAARGSCDLIVDGLRPLVELARTVVGRVLFRG